MRITNNMLINNMSNYISSNLSRMDKYQSQMATGKKIQVPSDDPVVAARALKLRTNVAEIEQYQKNIKDAQSWLDLTDDALSKIGDIFHRARELAMEGATGTYSQTDMKNMSIEMGQLRTQLIQLGNATYAGRYIFSGFKTDKKLLDDATGQFNIDVMTLSNPENINFEIGIGDDINVNVLGGDLFNNAGDATNGMKGRLVSDFDDLVNGLFNGDHIAVQNLVANLDTDMENLLRVRADVGARSNRLELAANRMESDSVNFTKLMSENEDVDMAETIMNLQNEQNVYRASLAGGAKIIQPTLLDFLR